jgi:branched-chain amino acid transport system ATP-binding protein
MALSFGEQKMLALARVLMGRPRMRLADEPTESLAPEIVNETFKFMESLRQDGTPILLVEQNLYLAVEVVHRFSAMERGWVVMKNSGDDTSHRVTLVQQLTV